MLTAMVVMVALVGAYVALQSIRSNAPASPVHTVDYRADVAPARKAAGFALVAPPRLPRGWRATTVSFSGEPGSHWHLGALTERDRYVGLEQGDEPVASMVQTYVDPDATRGAPQEVAGRTWSTYTDAKGDLALVRRAGRTTTLVVGHAVPRARLVAYTASLR
jgi:hypothetical protein